MKKFNTSIGFDAGINIYSIFYEKLTYFYSILAYISYKPNENLAFYTTPRFINNSSYIYKNEYQKVPKGFLNIKIINLPCHTAFSMAKKQIWFRNKSLFQRKLYRPHDYFNRLRIENQISLIVAHYYAVGFIVNLLLFAKKNGSSINEQLYKKSFLTFILPNAHRK